MGPNKVFISDKGVSSDKGISSDKGVDKGRSGFSTPPATPRVHRSPPVTRRYPGPVSLVEQPPVPLEHRSVSLPVEVPPVELPLVKRREGALGLAAEYHRTLPKPRECYVPLNWRLPNEFWVWPSGQWVWCPSLGGNGTGSGPSLLLPGQTHNQYLDSLP